MKQESKLLELLKIISDGNRLAILSLLKKSPSCVCEIFPSLKLPQNLVSHHLKVLKENGFVDSRKDGLKVIYSIKDKKVQAIKRLINKL
jgi:ArsR family transcriptional regulator